jgi:hypothetical protein
MTPNPNAVSGYVKTILPKQERNRLATGTETQILIPYGCGGRFYCLNLLSLARFALPYIIFTLPISPYIYTS